MSKTLVLEGLDFMNGFKSTFQNNPSKVLKILNDCFYLVNKNKNE